VVLDPVAPAAPAAADPCAGGDGDSGARLALEARLRVEAEELLDDARAELARSEAQCGRLRELLETAEADLCSERERLGRETAEAKEHVCVGRGAFFVFL
jgi:hypothetical protein